ncbi:MAG TPA: hypothetical protein VGG84_00995 [Gemmatimonadaceae bacterium]
MSDDKDSVTRNEPGSPANVGKSSPTAKRGEERGKEAGAKEGGTQGPSNRPTGGTSARESTGIDPQAPIDPQMPDLKRGGG